MFIEELISQLVSIKKNANPLKQAVIDDILKQYEDKMEDFIKYVHNNGYVNSGHHVQEFFDDYYENIMEYVNDYIAGTGYGLIPVGDIKTWYAEFGYHQAVTEIVLKLDI